MLQTTVAVAIALGLAIGVVAQESQESSRERLMGGISKGFDDSMYKAGSSGDRSLMPCLRQALHREKDKDVRRAARLALAKLGDREQQQAVFCEVEEVAGLTSDAQDWLKYVRGGFAVRTLATLFERDSEFDKIVKKHNLWKPSDDFLLMEPSLVAQTLLSELVPNPPVPGPTYTSELLRQQQIQLWHDWLSTHQTEIDNMQPNGEGVKFSKGGCRKSNRAFPAPK